MESPAVLWLSSHFKETDRNSAKRNDGVRRFNIWKRRRPDSALPRRYHVSMIQHEKWFGMARLLRSAAAVAILGTALLAALSHPADARGVHRFGRSFGGHGTFAGGRRHGNDTYIKAASDERDKLLTTRLKSICRGC